MRRPEWGSDWEAVRARFVLDPEIDFLNHGSFGACPEPVLDAQDRWRREMERRPVEFLYRRLPELLEEARAAVASFVRADPAELVFVPNATIAVNTVVAGLGLGAGDEVVTTDHAYPAVLEILRRRCAAAGARLRVAAIPLPLPPDDEIVGRVESEMSARTRLVIADHITSSTAAVFPVAAVVRAVRTRGVPVMVDSAHGPGMVEVDVRALGADFWTGNLHKWVCAPKGSAAFVARAEHQGATQPLAVSHDYLQTWVERFGWTGTHDPTPYLAAPQALGFMESLGWERVRAYGRDLAAYGNAVIAAAVGTAPIPPGEGAMMTLVELPPGTAGARTDALELTRALHDRHRVEVPVVPWGGRAFLRLSAMVYNHPEQYERLAGLLPGALAG